MYEANSVKYVDFMELCTFLFPWLDKSHTNLSPWIYFIIQKAIINLLQSERQTLLYQFPVFWPLVPARIILAPLFIKTFVKIHTGCWGFLMILRGNALVNMDIYFTCICAFLLCLLDFTALPFLYSETSKMHLLCALLPFAMFFRSVLFCF